jgi:hypothetical protein
MHPCQRLVGGLDAVRSAEQQKPKELTLLATRMLILELCQIVDVLIDDDVEVVSFVVGCHVGSCECL